MIWVDDSDTRTIVKSKSALALNSGPQSKTARLGAGMDAATGCDTGAWTRLSNFVAGSGRRGVGQALLDERGSAGSPGKEC
jgi:hypothetical protein